MSASTSAGKRTRDEAEAVVVEGGTPEKAAIIDQWKRGKLLDAELVAGGITFRAHRSILAARTYGGISVRLCNGRLLYAQIPKARPSTTDIGAAIRTNESVSIEGSHCPNKAI